MDLRHDAVLTALAIVAPLLVVACAAVVAVVLAIKSRTGSTGTLPGATGPGAEKRLGAPGPDSVGEAIDQAAALTEPDPTPRETAFARDVECWLADRDWPAPPIVPGRSES